MKPSYANLDLSTGFYTAGIYKLQIIPREWLIADPVIDFNTGLVTTPLQLQVDRNWLELELAPDTYEFEEKSKQAKAGSYFETTVSGLINSMNAAQRQVLETIRYNEVVALVHDKQKRLKVIGDTTTGMILRFSNKEDNTQGGKQQIALELSIQSEETAPFYSV